MAQKLYIEVDQVVRDLITKYGFTQNSQGRYMLDDKFLDHCTVADDCPEGYRPVAVHIVPFTIVEGEIIHYAFNTAQAPAIYVSFLIDVDDFVNHRAGDELMSPCQSVIGKIIRTLDAPHIDLKLDVENFKFPAVIDGEFIWAMEVKGDDHHTVDELVAQLGTVLGRVTKEQVLNGDVVVNKLSKDVVEYKAPDVAPDITVN
ncbi:hypothetical protein D3C78_762360 [compost metagenome]